MSQPEEAHEQALEGTPEQAFGIHATTAPVQECLLHVAASCTRLGASAIISARAVKLSLDFLPYSTDRRLQRQRPRPEPVPPPTALKIMKSCKPAYFARQLAETHRQP